MTRYVLCETSAAITVHARALRDGEEPRPNGGLDPHRTPLLCGMVYVTGWDLPHEPGPQGEGIRCRNCLQKYPKKEG